MKQEQEQEDSHRWGNDDPQVVVHQLKLYIEPLVREQHTEALRQLILQRGRQEGATHLPGTVEVVAEDESSLIAHYISHSFVPGCLDILDRLLHALASDRMTAVLHKNMPVLSINDLRIVYTVTEVLWTWGLERSVSHFSAFNGLAVSTVPKSMLVQRKALECVSSCLAVTHDFDHLYRIAACLKRVTFNDMFASLMVERSLDRIILSCFVMSNRTLLVETPPHSSNCSSSEPSITPGCQRVPSDAACIADKALQMLDEIRASSFCSMVVTRARVFLRGLHSWVRDAACLLLSSILGQRNGLQALITGYLDGCLDSPHLVALQMQVAQLATSTPVRSDRRMHLEGIARQTVDLLLLGQRRGDQMLIRVCVLITARISQLEAAICDRCILIPLSQPINVVHFSFLEDRHPSVYEQPSTHSCERVTFQSSPVVSEGWSTLAAVEMMHLLLTSCPIQRVLVDALYRCGITESMLSMYVFALGQHQRHPSTISDNAAAAMSGQLFSRLEQYSLSILKQEGQRATGLLLKIVLGSNNMWHYRSTAGGLVEIRRGKEGKSISLSIGTAHGHQDIDSIGGDDDLNRTIALAEMLEAQSDDDERFCLSSAMMKLRAVAETVKALEEVYQSCQLERIGSLLLDGCPRPQASKDGFECIGAQLFLELLHNYLLGGHQSMLEMITSGDPVNLTGGPPNRPESSESQSRRPLYGVLAVYFQSLLPLPVLLRDGHRVLIVLQSFLKHFVNDDETTGSGLDESESGSSIGGRCRLIEELQQEDRPDTYCPDTYTSSSSSRDYSSAECVLRLLLEIIDCKLPGDEEESLLVSLLPDLQRLALSRSEGEEEEVLKGDSIASLANDVTMKILLRSAPHLSSRAETASGGDYSFRDLLLELQTADYLLADSPSLRALGVSMIARSIKQSRRPFSDIEVTAGLDSLSSLLMDDQSFVYLHALGAVRSLVRHNPILVVSRLIELFSAVCCGERADIVAPCSHSYRANIVEALIIALKQARVVRQQHQLSYITIQHSLPSLVQACIRLARRRQQDFSAQMVDPFVDLQRMRVMVPGEKIDSESKYHDDALDESQVAIVDVAIDCAHTSIQRQSAIALLAEIIPIAEHNAHKYMLDITDICLGVLSLEAAYDQRSRSARRSAGFLLTEVAMFIRGQCVQQQFCSLSPRHLGYYQGMVPALRAIAGSERDEVVRIHVQESIAVIEDAILFLSLSGVKVNVIGSPSRRLDIDVSRYNMC